MKIYRIITLTILAFVLILLDSVLPVQPISSAKPSPSGQGLYPESPYVFTKDWFRPHKYDWENHLKELKGKSDIHALEIGSYEGLSAIWQIKNILTHPTSTITCIDIFEDKVIEDRFDRNIEATEVAYKVRKLKGSSEKMLRGLSLGKYNYVYIDGNHLAKWVLSDAVLSWDLIKPGGLIIFDDYHMLIRRARKFSPKIAIDAFLKIYEPHLEVVSKHGVSMFGSNFKKWQVIVRKKHKLAASIIYEDGIGDVCDPDYDNDGYCDPGEFDPSCTGSDNCQFVANPGQEDVGDGDGVGDICDNCPNDSNPNQEDNESDGIGDVCDPDDDNDGICDPGIFDPSCNGSDNCQFVYNPVQEDTYPLGGNNCGDACDCIGNLDKDGVVDIRDVPLFKNDFGKKNCTQRNPCKSDFDCDGDVDDDDYLILKENIGRMNCAACEFSCSYE